ncbi:efflux RND transporter periplasmic adaptor subunit [Ferrovibrio xuzhouensis]|uniref:Efflux RND transporter periplasmic adaptor subunit n=1 Tax=Ferrovibrio xuzhouensis TaxID=1576914 RepID=A0ABV7VAI0_9PROT
MALQRILGMLWHRKWLLVSSALVLCGLIALFLRWLLGPEVVVYPAVRTDMVRTVVASGHVETPFRVEIGSQITGTVAEVLVDEGQSVVRGQALIVIDPRELQAAVQQAEGAMAQSEARIRQLQELTLPSAMETLKEARANLVNAKAAYDRAAQLVKTGYGTRAALDDATRNLDVAQTQVRSAELAVFTAGPSGSDYVMAQTQLSQAQANLANAHARLDYATILAPRDGVLIARNVERGVVAQPGRALLVLAPAGDTQLVLQIDEKNLGLLKLGQNALASAEAYPDQTFPAVLNYINPSIDITRASVTVKLLAPNPPAYLRQDMTVSVDIEVERHSDTLSLPARTVHDATSATPWVLVLRHGRPQVQPVRIGLRAAQQVEILDGVSAGDTVVPVAAGVRAGQRIRPITP